MNFIALGAIAEVDDYYAGALYFCPLKQELEVALYFEPSNVGGGKHRKFKVKTGKERVLTVLYKSYRILYVSFYYYFNPYIAVAITYLIGGTVD